MSTPDDNQIVPEILSSTGKPRDLTKTAGYKGIVSLDSEKSSSSKTKAVELALAERQANSEKINATVQAARASATQPGSVEAQDHLALRVGRYASLLYACEQGSQSAAREVEKLILERDALQAQRDELLAALKQVRAMINQPVARTYGLLVPERDYIAAFEVLVGDCAIARESIDAAIARATEGGQS